MPFFISAFYFFYFASVGVYVIFLPKVLHDIGYTPLYIGIIFAISPLMRFITPFFFLKKIDLTHKVFINSLLVSIVLSFCFYFTINNFILFLINNLFLGISLSLILPYVEAIALSVLQKERYGKIRLFGSIGFMLIALVLAKFLDNSYVALHFYLVTVLCTALFAIILSNKHTRQSTNEQSTNDDFSLIKHWSFWLSMFLMQVSFGSFYNFYTIYETSKGISLDIVSYLWSFGVLCEIVMLYFQAPLLKRFDLMNLIKISIVLTSVRWFIVFLFGDSIAISFVAQAFHSLSFALYHSAVSMYLFSLYQNKKLAQQFLFGVAYGLGGFVGALVAGKLYGDYLFLSSSIIAFCAYLVLIINKKAYLR